MRIKTALVPLAIPFFLGCFASLPPPPNREKIQAFDGRWVEQRVERNLSRRPMEVYYVYQDSNGNYLRHGTDTHYYMSGQVKMEEHYRNGLLDSITEFWHPNGNKRGELPYKDGKPHGRAVTWYPDGKKQSETNWENGLLNGPSLEWDENGNVVKKVVWKDNRVDSATAQDSTKAP